MKKRKDKMLVCDVAEKKFACKTVSKLCKRLKSWGYDHKPESISRKLREYDEGYTFVLEDGMVCKIWVVRLL